jgi:hypothetical protein
VGRRIENGVLDVRIFGRDCWKRPVNPKFESFSSFPKVCDTAIYEIRGSCRFNSFLSLTLNLHHPHHTRNKYFREQATKLRDNIQLIQIRVTSLQHLLPLPCYNHRKLILRHRWHWHFQGLLHGLPRQDRIIPFPNRRPIIKIET